MEQRIDELEAKVLQLTAQLDHLRQIVADHLLIEHLHGMTGYEEKSKLQKRIDKLFPLRGPEE